MSTEDIYKQHLNEGHQAALDAVFAAGQAAERAQSPATPSDQSEPVTISLADYMLKSEAQSQLKEVAGESYQKGVAEGRAELLAEIEAAAHAKHQEIAPQAAQATPTQPAIVEPSAQPQAPITSVAPGAPLSL